jgi:hypothetical protein
VPRSATAYAAAPATKRLPKLDCIASSIAPAGVATEMHPFTAQAHGT